MSANNNFRHWTAILAPLPAVLAGRLFSRVRVRERDAKAHKHHKPHTRASLRFPRPSPSRLGGLEGETLKPCLTPLPVIGGQPLPALLGIGGSCGGVVLALVSLTARLSFPSGRKPRYRVKLPQGISKFLGSGNLQTVDSRFIGLPRYSALPSETGFLGASAGSRTVGAPHFLDLIVVVVKQKVKLPPLLLATTVSLHSAAAPLHTK